jgi:serine phosphatase RsbU (regulator of sigma subunit)
MLVAVAVGAAGSAKSASPAAVLSTINQALLGRTGGGFVTACCARFDPDGRMTIANAGHLPPYCDGQEVAIAGGLPLGLAAEVAYEEAIHSGERFTFVSDGLVEAENAQRELFGFERAKEISLKSAREIADAAKAWGQNDDITVVTVRRDS